jgi:hypothetical protein
MTGKLTKEQGAILSAFTGKLCGRFSDFAEYAERKLGRPIFTHEYPGLMGDIKEASRADFMAIMPEGTPTPDQTGGTQ